MRSAIAAALQILGAGLVSVAGFTVAPGLGLLAAGVGLLAFGLAAERDTPADVD